MQKWDIYTNKANGSRYMQEQDDGRFYAAEDVDEKIAELQQFYDWASPQLVHYGENQLRIAELESRLKLFGCECDSAWYKLKGIECGACCRAKERKTLAQRLREKGFKIPSGNQKLPLDE